MLVQIYFLARNREGLVRLMGISDCISETMSIGNRAGQRAHAAGCVIGCLSVCPVIIVGGCDD